MQTNSIFIAHFVPNYISFHMIKRKLGLTSTFLPQIIDLLYIINKISQHGITKGIDIALH